ncbi:DMT family transporter [Rhodovarius crocodyli]|uniref:DMT family transporter n=1 Tax=Rhodovarius crocodyli TaxID=1979269 RepID=UPI001F0C1F91|nr:DMT family transporter [Rhodovarius crocodyli]
MNQAKGLRLLLISVLLFGGVWPISKHALMHDATPVWFATSRAGLAALASSLFLLAMGRFRLPARGDWPAILSIATFQLAGFFLASHIALPMVGAARTAVLGNVTLMWLVPMSMLVLGEKVSPRRWVAVGLAALGVFVMLNPWTMDTSAPGMLAGHLWLLAASLSWSFAILMTRRFPPVSPMMRLLPFCFALAGSMLLLAATIREPQGGIGSGALWHAAFVGLIAAPVGTWAVIESGRLLNAVTASVGFLLVPVLGLGLSAFWLHEPMGWDLMLGGALIVASVVVAAKG